MIHIVTPSTGSIHGSLAINSNHIYFSQPSNQIHIFSNRNALHMPHALHFACMTYFCSVFFPFSFIFGLFLAVFLVIRLVRFQVSFGVQPSAYTHMSRHLIRFHAVGKYTIYLFVYTRKNTKSSP